MDFLEQVKNRIVAIPFIVLIILVLSLYILGSFANQGNLIRTIESYREKNITLEQQLTVLKNDLQKKNQFFLAEGDNRCLTKPYVPEYYIISRTDETDWCNIRTFKNGTEIDNGYDIFFPSTASIEMRGALAVIENSQTVFIIQEASAEAKQVGSYDSITMHNGNTISRLIQDIIVSKQIIRIHNQQVLFVTTKDKQNKKTEHYLIDNGNVQDKRVYDISFYSDLPEEQKNVILNSFSPRFQ